MYCTQMRLKLIIQLQILVNLSFVMATTELTPVTLSITERIYMKV